MLRERREGRGPGGETLSIRWAGCLDTCVLGSADWHMAFGLVQGPTWRPEMKRCTQPYVESVLNGQARAAK